ncbi:MAG: glycosyltransferase, partial [Campylobacterales bacterium]
PGKELLAFCDPKQAAKLANEYLEKNEDREKIAAAGQAKTLSNYTYEKKVRLLYEIANSSG